MSQLAALNEQIAAKNQQLAAIFEKGIDKLSADEVKDIQQRNAELTDLGKQRDQLISLDEIAQQTKAREEQELKRQRLGPGSTSDQQPEVKTRNVRQMLTESKSYERFRAGQVKSFQLELSDHEFKTLVTLGDMTPQAQRLPGMVESVQLPLMVSDLMLQGNTDNNSIEYWEETTFTNNAAEVAEGGTKPESGLDWTLRTDSVRKIATWIPVTDEALSDVAGLESIIRQRLPFMVAQRRESQLINGNGVAPNISGILNRTGLQTQAKGTDPTPDAIYKAMTKIRVTGGAEPTAVLMHPNDWMDIRLLRTADGVYIWGNPSEAGPERIWGLNVRATTAMTENTGLVGAFRPHAQFFRRSGITITASTEHSTYFVENKVAILAEERVALAVYRPAAFCTVTGI